MNHQCENVWRRHGSGFSCGEVAVFPAEEGGWEVRFLLNGEWEPTGDVEELLLEAKLAAIGLAYRHHSRPR